MNDDAEVVVLVAARTTPTPIEADATEATNSRAFHVSWLLLSQFIIRRVYQQLLPYL
jgi:hypothetical protein